MSNALKQQFVAQHLEPFHIGDERLGVLLALSVGRLMVRALKQSRDLHNEFPDDGVRHVADWLKAAIVNDAKWLKNVDHLSRPKKLLKHGSFKALLAEADRSMLIESQKAGDVKLIEGDESLYATLDDGMVLVRLLTAAALDRESAEMQHCIGNGAYDNLLHDRKHAFFSLRDRHGKPHATLEIEGNKLKQLRGKQNSPPIKKYVSALVPLLKTQQVEVKIPIFYLGYVIDKDGDWHEIDNLPKGLTVDGNLNLRGTDIKSLPEGLVVYGDMDLDGTFITSLPTGMKVGGWLDVNHTAITCLPDNLEVGTWLDISNSAVTHLPSGLKVGGWLDASNTNISCIPEDMVLGSSLCLRETKITNLPEGLMVSGDLDLRYTPIKSLPDGLSVGKNLYITDTELDELPSPLKVGGDLDLRDTRVRSLQEGLEVGGRLLISGTEITSMPRSIANDTVVSSRLGRTSAAAFRNVYEVIPQHENETAEGRTDFFCR